MSSDEEIETLQKRLTEITIIKANITNCDRTLDLIDKMSSIDHVYSSSISFHTESLLRDKNSYTNEISLHLDKEQHNSLMNYVKRLLSEPMIQQRKQYQSQFDEM